MGGLERKDTSEDMSPCNGRFVVGAYVVGGRGRGFRVALDIYLKGERYVITDTEICEERQRPFRDLGTAIVKRPELLER